MNHVEPQFKERLAAATARFQQEMRGVRTNRPTPALIEDVKVSYYGEMLPLKQLGSIAVAPPRDIIVQVWDKEAVAAVVKAIESSSLGLSASGDGGLVRLRLPELSSERREELVRHARRAAEQYRIQIRNLRDEVNKEIQKLLDDGNISEDMKFKLREMAQKHTDEANKTIGEILERKVAEINE